MSTNKAVQCYPQAIQHNQHENPSLGKGQLTRSTGSLLVISCPPTSVDVGVVPLPDVVDVAEVVEVADVAEVADADVDVVADVCKTDLKNACV